MAPTTGDGAPRPGGAAGSARGPRHGGSSPSQGHRCAQRSGGAVPSRAEVARLGGGRRPLGALRGRRGCYDTRSGRPRRRRPGPYEGARNGPLRAGHARAPGPTRPRLGSRWRLAADAAKGHCPRARAPRAPRDGSGPSRPQSRGSPRPLGPGRRLSPETRLGAGRTVKFPLRRPATSSPLRLSLKSGAPSRNRRSPPPGSRGTSACLVRPDKVIREVYVKEVYKRNVNFFF